MARIDVGWLRVLAEIGRRGSFSAAAAALGLTQPAVSYQIRRLEEQFGFPLIRRLHGGVELTAKGRALFDIALRSVEDIDRFARENAQSQRPAVRLRTDYAFASFWLIPRMHGFRERHPDIDIQIVATQAFEPADMEDTDIAVVFGEQQTFGADATLLVAEKVMPVCSSAMGASAAEQLLERRLIHLDAPLTAPWFDWTAYFRALGLERPISRRQGDLSFNTYSLVIQAALENQGVALGWFGLIDSLLRSGILVAAGPPVEFPGRGYVLLPTGRSDSNSRDFMSWLIAEAAKG
jgi:putative choline sulfate-utilization transcription factor